MYFKTFTPHVRDFAVFAVLTFTFGRLRKSERSEQAFSDALLDLQAVLVADADLCGTCGS